MAKKRTAQKFHIKKGDKVIVIAGDDKDLNRTRDVLEIIYSKYRAIVDGVNIRKKHKKTTQDQRGGIVEINTSIHLSNLMLADPKTGEPTRIGRKVVDGKLVRYSKKSGETIG